MRFAEHLAVVGCCCAAFAPGGYVVGIHIGQFIEPGFVGIVAKGAKRTVGGGVGFVFGGLLGVNGFFGCFVKNPDIKQFSVHGTAEDIFKNAFSVFYVFSSVFYNNT
jgi:hypothetical protein